MPINRNDFYGGSGVPRRILPSFNFQPVIRPYAGAPIEEFANTVQSLRKDYETATLADDSLEQAYRNMQYLSAPGDEQLARELQDKYRQRLSQRAERGDYENMVRETRKDAMNFVSEYDPIKRNLETYNQFVGELQKRDDIADKQRLIDFSRNQYVQSGGLQRDPITGQIKNQFTGRQFVGDVNVPEVIDKAMQGAIKELYPEKINEIDQYGLLEFIKKEGISQDRIKQITRTALKQNPNVTAYLQQEQLLSGKQPYDKDKIIDQVINDYAVRKYGVYRRDANYMQNPIALQALKSGYEKPNLGIIVSDRGAAVGFTPQTYKDLSKQNRNLELLLESNISEEEKANISSQLNWNKNLLSSIDTKAKEGIKDEISSIYKEIQNVNPSKYKSEDDFINYIKSLDEDFLQQNPNLKFTTQGGSNPTYTKTIEKEKEAFKLFNDKVEDVINNAKTAIDFTYFDSSKGTSENPKPIGDTNYQLTELWKNNSGNYQLAYGDQQLSESYLKEKYGEKDENIKLSDGTKVLGRDPEKDYITMGNGFDYNGRPVMRLSFRNKQGRDIGSEQIISKDEGTNSNIRDIAQALIQEGTDVVKENGTQKRIITDNIRYQQGISIIGGEKYTQAFLQADGFGPGERQWNRTLLGETISTERVGDKFSLKIGGNKIDRMFLSPIEIYTYLADVEFRNINK